MREVKLPSDERNAILNWAQLGDQKLWDVVPRARPFMIKAAAAERAAATFYGPLEVMYPLYIAMAEQIIAELKDK